MVSVTRLKSFLYHGDFVNYGCHQIEKRRIKSQSNQPLALPVLSCRAGYSENANFKTLQLNLQLVMSQHPCFIVAERNQKSFRHQTTSGRNIFIKTHPLILFFYGLVTTTLSFNNNIIIFIYYIQGHLCFRDIAIGKFILDP